MCASFNKVMLIGNLTRDPECRGTESSQVVSFGLAMSRQYMSARREPREETVFVDVEAWGRVGEIVSQYCRKGNPLFVEGRLRYDQWDDRESGQRRSRLVVRAENIQLLGAPNRGGAYGGDQGGVPSSYQGGGQAFPPPPASMPAFQPIGDDTPVSPF